MPHVGDSVEIWSNTTNRFLPGKVDRIDGLLIYVVYKYPDGREAQKPVQAGHAHIRGYGAAAFANSVAFAATSLESDQERKAIDQLRAGTVTRLDITTQDMPGLSKDGQCDNLLASGNSSLLLRELPQIFKNDPPNEAGRKDSQVGTFHGFHGGTYPRKVFSADAVLRTLRLAEKLWGRSRNIERLTIPQKGRLVVVGDTHGQLEDVLWMFFKYGPPSPSNQYLFNGDIVDRGGHALEILLLLLCIKRDNMDSVHILRGNHEDAQVCSLKWGFRAELESKFPAGQEGSWLLNACVTEVFPHLPIFAVVSDRRQSRNIAVVHGGIPVDLPGQRGAVTLNFIESINRRVPSCIGKADSSSPEKACLFNMLWADPQVGTAKSSKESEGRGAPFSESATMDFCRTNHLSQVVRSHQLPGHLGFPGEGQCTLHSDRCRTVFSASNYCGSVGNKGSVLIITDDHDSMQPTVSDHWAPAWPDLARLIASGVRDPRALSEAEGKSRACVMGVGMPTGSQAGGPFAGQPPDAASRRSNQSTAALQQVENVVVELICWKKKELLKAFDASDTRNTMTVPLDTWIAVMSQKLTEVPAVWPALADAWSLKDPVPFIEFLHRFRIVAESPKSFDAFKSLDHVRLQVSDLSAKQLLAEFGGHSDREVSREQFQHFLNKWGADVSEAQAMSMYNGIKVYLNRTPSAEDVLLSVALMSTTETTTSSRGAEIIELAKWLGTALTAEDAPLAGFFIYHDLDRDGFLSTEEFIQAIEAWQSTGKKQHLRREQLHELALLIDAQGQKNGRIGLMEFLRALGPRSFAMELAALLLAEVLMPVYFYKPTLMEHLYEHAWRTTVSKGSFYKALEEMNGRMTQLGDTPLRPEQMSLICEIAGGSGERIHYREFLDSLRVVDTYKRQQLAEMGASIIGAALGSRTSVTEDPHRRGTTLGRMTQNPFHSMSAAKNSRT